MSFDVNAEAKRMMMREGDMESFLNVGEGLAADTAGSRCVDRKVAIPRGEPHAIQVAGERGLAVQRGAATSFLSTRIFQRPVAALNLPASCR